MYYFFFYCIFCGYVDVKIVSVLNSVFRISEEIFKKESNLTLNKNDKNSNSSLNNNSDASNTNNEEHSNLYKIYFSLPSFMQKYADKKIIAFLIKRKAKNLIKQFKNITTKQRNQLNKIIAYLGEDTDNFESAKSPENLGIPNLTKQKSNPGFYTVKKFEKIYECVNVEAIKKEFNVKFSKMKIASSLTKEHEMNLNDFSAYLYGSKTLCAARKRGNTDS